MSNSNKMEPSYFLEVIMATNRRVFTLRLPDDIFDKIGKLASSERRSMTNYIEFVLLKHLEEIEQKNSKTTSNDR